MSRSEQLVGYFYSTPLLGVAYCLAQPCLALCITPASGQPSLFTQTHAGAANRLGAAGSRCLQQSQFIEDTAEPSFFCWGLSPCSSCAQELLEIILWQADEPRPSRTPVAERITRYCTWQPSALTIRSWRQVKERSQRYKKLLGQGIERKRLFLISVRSHSISQVTDIWNSDVFVSALFVGCAIKFLGKVPETFVLPGEWLPLFICDFPRVDC